MGTALFLADSYHLMEVGCSEAKVALLSKWPILGLAAQVPRFAPPSKTFVDSNDHCGRFLEMVPAPPMDTSSLVHAAVEFLDRPLRDLETETKLCLLATAISLSIVMQGMPRLLLNA